MAAEVRVNSYRANFQDNPDIAVLADGSYLVVWDSYYDGGTSGLSPTTYIAAQHFSRSLKKSAPRNGFLSAELSGFGFGRLCTESMSF